jgi:hypothetical protein
MPALPRLSPRLPEPAAALAGVFAAGGGTADAELSLAARALKPTIAFGSGRSIIHGVSAVNRFAKTRPFTMPRELPCVSNWVITTLPV